MIDSLSLSQSLSSLVVLAHTTPSRRAELALYVLILPETLLRLLGMSVEFIAWLRMCVQLASRISQYSLDCSV